MPETLDRCVAHVMGKGHDESSAYAICRTSLGLAEDGSSDEECPEMPDDEMKVLAENEISRRAFAGEPTYRKWMVVARPIGEFVNGGLGGDLGADVIEALVRNFSEHPRKVPVFLWHHVEDLDQEPPDGWVEGLRLGDGGTLEADVKLHGEAVAMVLGDRVRGASIAWRPDAPGYDGESIGPVLTHLTLTNNPYIKGLPNIAAAREQGGRALLFHFTALHDEEVGMSDDPKNKKQDPPEKKDGGQEKAPEVQLKEAKDALIEVKAENLRLKEQVETLEAQLANRKVDHDKESLAVENINLKRRCFAQDIRALVSQGLSTGTLKAAWCDGYAGKSVLDFEGTVTWLKASRFYDKAQPDAEMQAFRLLKFQVESGEPLYRVGQTYRSGQPGQSEELALTDTDRQLIRDMKLTPEQVLAGKKASGRQEYQALTQKEK